MASRPRVSAASISSRYGAHALAVGERPGDGGVCSEVVESPGGRAPGVGGHLYGRICRGVAPPAGGPHGEPGSLQVGAGGLAPHARGLLDAPERPAQPPKCQNLLSLVVAQDIAHAGERDHSPSRRVNVLSAYSLWPVLRCRPMAGLGCPPRDAESGAVRIAGAADGHQRHSPRHIEFAHGRATGVRHNRRQRSTSVQRTLWGDLPHGGGPGRSGRLIQHPRRVSEAHSCRASDAPRPRHACDARPTRRHGRAIAGPRDGSPVPAPRYQPVTGHAKPGGRADAARRSSARCYRDRTQYGRFVSREPNRAP